MKNKIIQIIKAFLLIAAAVLVLSNPKESIVMLASYLGFLAIIFGILGIISKFVSERKGIYSNKGYLEGIIGIIFGIILFNNPENMINILMILFGIMSLLISFIQFNLFRGLKGISFRNSFILFSAILSFGISMLLLFNPFHSAQIIAIIIGVYILLYGLTLLFQAMRLMVKR